MHCILQSIKAIGQKRAAHASTSAIYAPARTSSICTYAAICAYAAWDGGEPTGPTVCHRTAPLRTASRVFSSTTTRFLFKRIFDL